MKKANTEDTLSMLLALSDEQKEKIYYFLLGLSSVGKMSKENQNEKDD
jgi:hypothetical protein